MLMAEKPKRKFEWVSLVVHIGVLLVGLTEIYLTLGH